MMDSDFFYWQSMQSRYWLTYYLIDKQGIVRTIFIGEMHSGTEPANTVGADMHKILAESS